jgi:hypothetical protein
MFDSGQKWAGFVWSGQISAFPGHTGSAFRTSASLPPKARRAYNVKGAHASRMIRITASRFGRAIGRVGERANGGLAGRRGRPFRRGQRCAGNRDASSGSVEQMAI